MKASLTSASVLLGAACAAGTSAASYHHSPASSGSQDRTSVNDYVVVGGRTAGLATATRLAEDTLNTVAIIEAGGFYEIDHGNSSVVPRYVLASPIHRRRARTVNRPWIGNSRRHHKRH